jgi:flavin-dependent dehydrogenase
LGNTFVTELADNGSEQTISIPARRVPVAYDADVVVVGAGPAGFAAALKAAREGARVLVVERFDMPGGVHTSGLQGSANVGVGGIHSELMQRFAAAGYIYTATQDTLPNWVGNPLSHYERYHKPDAPFARASFNPEGAGSLMAALLKDAGVIALYNTSFVDVVLQDGVGDSTITAIIVENASGRQAITGKIFIEGSGTAQLAAAAGVPFVRGGGPQPDTTAWDGMHRPIPGGLLWIMSNIAFARTVAHQTSAHDPHLSKLIAEADAAGDLPKGLYLPRMQGQNV